MEDRKLEFGFIKTGVLYRNVNTTDNGLELKALTDEELESSVLFFQEEFKKFTLSFSKLNEQINNSENKGSFLVKLQNLKSQLNTHKGLGDYDSIEDQIINLENLINDTIAKNRERNTSIKQALILELDEALKNNDFYEVGETIKTIKQRWIKTGSANEDVREKLESEFEFKVQSFFEKRKSFFEDKKRLQASKIEKYETIIQKLKDINGKKVLKSEIDNVKVLQTEWKSLSNIPEKDYKPLNNKYWNECKKFFNSVKQERKAQDSLSKEALAKNLASKKELIQLMTSLDESALTKNITKEFNDLKNKWKEIGRTEKQESQKLHNTYYDLNGAIMEKQFIFNLANKKFKSFATDSLEKRLDLLKKLTHDLLKRDKTDLAAFKENMENMHVNKGSFVTMLEEKLTNYQRKVELKTKILSTLKK